MDELARKKRTRLLALFSTIFALLLLGWLLYYLLYGRFFVETEDAYVNGNQVIITPQVTGGIVKIFADNTDLVEQGQVIVQLDITPFEITLREKKEQLASTVREVSQLFENVKEQQALLEVRNAELNQQKLNLANRAPLLASRAVSGEEYEQNQTNVTAAEANYTYALASLEAARALVQGTEIHTHPRVLAAATAVREAYLNLLRCDVVAPARGYVAKRSAQVGDWVMAGETLMIVVPLDFLWFDANYKETQLKNVRIGQDVAFTADLYGTSRKFQGKVLGFTSGTGSAFQLLPAQNATGNWIKIVQRLPIRVSIDPKQIQENPLFIGLSIRSSIDVRDTSGAMLCLVPQVEPVYTTYIYNTQAEALQNFEPQILEIIEKNACSSCSP